MSGQDGAAADTPLAADPFVFSLGVDGSRPMPPDFVTKRVALLKEHLGIILEAARRMDVRPWREQP